jgi:hypothetical protein
MWFTEVMTFLSMCVTIRHQFVVCGITVFSLLFHIPPCLESKGMSRVG